MAIIHDPDALDDYLLGVLPSLVPSDVKARYPNDKTGQINTVLGKNPLLFDRYLADAIEIDVDALSDGADGGRRRHHGAYRRGRHSFGRQRLLAAAPLAQARDDRRASRTQTQKLARALEVGGLMNVQYALKGGEIYVLEVNPRASRTVPFVAKVIGRPIAGDRRARHGGRNARFVRSQASSSSTTSGSRKRCFPSPASPASTPCSGRKCARPAR